MDKLQIKKIVGGVLVALITIAGFIGMDKDGVIDLGAVKIIVQQNAEESIKASAISTGSVVAIEVKTESIKVSKPTT